MIAPHARGPPLVIAPRRRGPLVIAPPTLTRTPKAGPEGPGVPAARCRSSEGEVRSSEDEVTHAAIGSLLVY